MKVDSTRKYINFVYCCHYFIGMKGCQWKIVSVLYYAFKMCCGSAYFFAILCFFIANSTENKNIIGMLVLMLFL
jgi:hypothetical protein